MGQALKQESTVTTQHQAADWDVIVVGHANSGKSAIISQIQKSSYAKHFKSFQPLTLDDQLLTPKNGIIGKPVSTYTAPHNYPVSRMPISRMPVSRAPVRNVRRMELPPMYPSDAIIYVLDIQNDNMKSIAEALEYQVVSHVFGKNVPMLFFANKKEMSDKSIRNISTDLGLTSNPQLANWSVQPCNALTGEGIEEGLEWLSSVVGQQVDEVQEPVYVPMHHQSRQPIQYHEEMFPKKRSPAKHNDKKSK